MKVDRVEAKKGEFVQTAVEWLAKAINKAIEQDGECVLGLSGGMFFLSRNANQKRLYDINYRKTTVALPAVSCRRWPKC